jgi:hypothetical protein
MWDCPCDMVRWLCRIGVWEGWRYCGIISSGKGSKTGTYGSSLHSGPHMMRPLEDFVTELSWRGAGKPPSPRRRHGLPKRGPVTQGEVKRGGRLLSRQGRDHFSGLLLLLSDSERIIPESIISWVGLEEKEKDNFKWRSTRN